MSHQASKAHPVGIAVRSRYAAPWTGVVVASGRDYTFHKIGTMGECTLFQSVPVTRTGEQVTLTYVLTYVPGQGYQHPTPFYFLSHPGCVVVKVTYDRNGHPMRKALYKVLDSFWLEVI